MLSLVCIIYKNNQFFTIALFENFNNIFIQILFLIFVNAPHLFTLGRIIDKNYLPNCLIIIITTLAFTGGIIFYFFKGNNFIDSISYGILLTLATFFSWALTREIYPQGEYTSLAAAIVTMVSLAWFGFVPIIIITLLWFILNLRLINQTTGMKPSIIDRFIIFIFTIIVAYFLSWIFLFFMIFTNLINYKLSKEISDILFFLLGFVGGSILSIFQKIWYNQSSLTYQNGFFVSILLIIFLVMMWMMRNIRVVGDFSKKQIPPIRIFSAQFTSTLFCIGYILWFGDVGIIMLLPLWCGIICSIISSGVNVVYRKN
jgi:hypothetical protein